MTEPERRVPDLEDLAAYVDGRLSPERRAWVEEHLARDEELYEVFLGTVAFQQEHGPTAAKKKLRLSTRRIFTGLAIAALLVLAIGVRFWRPPPTAETWAKQLEPTTIIALGEDWSDPGWSRNRSVGDCPPAEGHAFRLGAWTLDLRLALAASDVEQIERLTGQLEHLADECAHLFLGLAYRQLHERWEGLDAVSRQELVGDIEEQIEELFAQDPSEASLFRLGGWAEAGRHAALTKDAKALKSIIRNHPKADPFLPIDDLEKLAKRSRLEPKDFEAAAEAFGEIIKTLAR